MESMKFYHFLIGNKTSQTLCLRPRGCPGARGSLRSLGRPGLPLTPGPHRVPPSASIRSATTMTDNDSPVAKSTRLSPFLSPATCAAPARCGPPRAPTVLRFGPAAEAAPGRSCFVSALTVRERPENAHGRPRGCPRPEATDTPLSLLPHWGSAFPVREAIPWSGQGRVA